MDAIEARYAHLEDEGIRAFMVAGERFYPPGAVNFSISEQRDFYNLYAGHFRKPRPLGSKTADFALGEISCRLYTPPNHSDTTVLYLHGGGFILGGLESHDDICAELASASQCPVIAVAYRLAPEHPFPAALDDCFAVLKSIDGPVITAGDSAGGNLAAALCLKARDLAPDVQIKGQVLIYPGLGGDISKGSYITQANAPGLTTADVLYYRDVYKGGNAYAEPLNAASHANLPPAFMIAAGLDPLHDDCADYAEKLKANGIQATVRSEPQLVHAFLRARHMSKPAAKSFAAIIAAIRGFAA